MEEKNLIQQEEIDFETILDSLENVISCQSVDKVC